MTAKYLRRALAARRAFSDHESTVDGCRVYARRSLTNPDHPDPPVVVIGGVALSGRYLLPAAALIANSFPVWLPDPPGFGRSQAPTAKLKVDQLADLLAAWMDEIDLPRAALVANSFGCQVAAEIAVRHPAQVSHLVLQAPTVDAKARSLPRQVLRTAVDAVHEPPTLGPVQLLDWFRTGLRRKALTLGSMVEHCPETLFPQISVPTLVVRGVRDAIVPQRWAEEVTALLPRGELAVVPGAPHTMPYSAPLELARLTRYFLERHAASASGSQREGGRSE